MQIIHAKLYIKSTPFIIQSNNLVQKYSIARIKLSRPEIFTYLIIEGVRIEWGGLRFRHQMIIYPPLFIRWTRVYSTDNVVELAQLSWWILCKLCTISRMMGPPWEGSPWGSLPWECWPWGSLPWEGSPWGSLPWEGSPWGSSPCGQRYYYEIWK